MSINVEVRCSREIFIPSSRRYELQVEYLDVWQTPTEDTRKIVNSEDQFGAYMEWVLANSDTVTEPLFWNYEDYVKHCLDEDSIEPDYWWTYNIGIEHLMELYDEIENMRDQGFKVEWTAW